MLVSLDTLRADRLNCYGYRGRQVSPALDRLAGDNLLFENHITASPWTTPAHLSLLTSLSPSSHGVMTPFPQAHRALERGVGFERLAAEHPTLAEVLARSGYATAAMTGGVSLDPRIGFDRGFERYDTSLAKVRREGTAQIAEWIGQQSGRPFFLFLHTFEVHAPYTRAMYLGSVLPAERAAELGKALAKLENGPDFAASAVRGMTVLTHHKALELGVVSALYDGGVRTADAWVGELIEVLKHSGLYDKTLLIVTSDHGEQLGESSGAFEGRVRDGRFYNLHGHDLYEEMLHVPLIVKLPGRTGVSQRVTAVTRAIDVMPTILDVLGVSTRGLKLQGVSLRPLWEGGEATGRLAFAEGLVVKRESKGLREGRYKYIVSASPAQVGTAGRAQLPADPETAELYDLQQDPGEQRNLLPSADERIRRRADEFARELRRLASGPPGTPERMRPSKDLIENLRALGYVE